MDATTTSSGKKQTFPYVPACGDALSINASMHTVVLEMEKPPARHPRINGARLSAASHQDPRTRILSLCRFSKLCFPMASVQLVHPLQTLPARLVEFFNSRRKQEMIQPQSGVSVSRARRDPKGCTGLKALGKGAASLRKKGTHPASPTWA